MDILSGGLASNASILSGGREIVFAGGTDIGATISSGGTEEIGSAGGTGIVTTLIASGGIFVTLSGGTAIVSGAVTDFGTLIASGLGSLLEIESDGVVNGGAVVVGNGIVDVLSGGTANVKFLSNGSGGLEIADTQANPAAFTGTVSGFGGMNHTNHKQFIDLVSVVSAPNTISWSYASASGSGTLFVSSGGAVVAQINLIGNYTSANFSAKADGDGNVVIVDPAVPNGGSAPSPAESFPRHGVDLPDIAFGAQTTLAYSENTAGNGGTLTVNDGRHAAAIALLGNYMAGSFATTADGHGGTLVTEASQAAQPLLAARIRVAGGTRPERRRADAGQAREPSVRALRPGAPRPERSGAKQGRDHESTDSRSRNSCRRFARDRSRHQSSNKWNPGVAQERH